MKKIIAFCLSLLLVFTPLWVLGAEKTAPANKGYLGDVNLDGKVNALDALRILQFAAKKVAHDAPLYEADAAEINGDRTVDAKDALEVLKYAVKKDSVLTQGVVHTDMPGEGGYAYWKVVEDNICTTEQAWLCQTYEEYRAFLQLGFVEESQRKIVYSAENKVPNFDEAFFETYGLVLWYRMCGLTTGSLHWENACVKNERVYLDICPYDTCVIDPQHAIDEIYGFYYQKGNHTPNTVIMRKKYVGQLYSEYALAQFDFM